MKFNIGDMAEFVNDKVKDAKFGVVVDISNDLIDTPYFVFIYDSKGNYIGARYFGEDDLDEANMNIAYSYKLVTYEDGCKFRVNDRVKMVDGMDNKYFNSVALDSEFGIIRQVDNNDEKLKYHVEFYNPYHQVWCEEKQLRLVE